ncbi:ribonuclease III [uncultured Maricaulis sp.]|uniref:ribonuclease III n=1 Tax=uncultured Maricaulis sp. TaxID=174710 RepID=UPI0030DDCB26|tara:strand:+ start:43698 stop:44387 length:690 start_codon:yes stop_codon:yes gene_type:complete
MIDPTADLESRIGYVFKDRKLIERALTHSSFGDGRPGFRSYERLEFLGDRVLGMMTAEALYQAFDTAAEGALAPRLNALVRKETCAEVARAIDLGSALRMGRSEEKSGGRAKTSILGDACEALMAALYLDGGRPCVQAFYDAHWSDKLEALKQKPRDAKSMLQEWAAKVGHAAPRYQLTGRSGPDHRPVFTVQVTISPLEPAIGEGGTKQTAERAAAEALLNREGHDVG